MITALLAQLVIVAGAGGHATVGAALAAAGAHDTVLVRPGRYLERLEIDQAVVLRGEPGAVIDGGGRGDVVRVTAPGVAVLGLRITGSGTELNTDDAAIRITAGDARIEGVTIERSLHGIYVQDAEFVALVGNTILGHPGLAEADRGNAIHLHNSRHVRMERNVIRGVRDGLYFSYADSTEAIGNTVTESRYGIHYMYSRGNRFIANRFTRNAAGAALMYSWDLVAVANTFSDHRSYRGYGLVLQTTENARLLGNRFERNRVGVLADNALNGSFTENVIANNGIGLDLLASVAGNVFTGNAFVGNGADARTARGLAPNRWSRAGRGNYWSSALGLDADRDGVRDVPHREGSAFTALASGRPALHLWRSSPAMSLLNVAERELPVFNVPTVTDSFPLARLPNAAAAPAPPDTRHLRPDPVLLGLIAAAAGATLLGVFGLRRV